MELHPQVLHEWHDDHALSRRSIHWIQDHTDANDPHPITTAIAALRASGAASSTTD